MLHKFIFLSSFGKSYTLDGENLVFGSQKGKPFSSYFSLKENEEIEIDGKVTSGKLKNAFMKMAKKKLNLM